MSAKGMSSADSESDGEPEAKGMSSADSESDVEPEAEMSSEGKNKSTLENSGVSTGSTKKEDVKEQPGSASFSEDESEEESEGESEDDALDEDYAVLEKAPAKTAKPAVPRVKLSRVNKTAGVTHPKYSEMVVEAVSIANSPRSGISLQLIKKFIREKYPESVKIGDQYIRSAIKKNVELGVLLQVTGTGANGSFKLAKPLKTTPKQKNVQLGKGANKSITPEKSGKTAKKPQPKRAGRKGSTTVKPTSKATMVVDKDDSESDSQSDSDSPETNSAKFIATSKVNKTVILKSKGPKNSGKSPGKNSQKRKSPRGAATEKRNVPPSSSDGTGRATTETSSKRKLSAKSPVKAKITPKAASIRSDSKSPGISAPKSAGKVPVKSPAKSPLKTRTGKAAAAAKSPKSTVQPKSPVQQTAKTRVNAKK